MNCYYHPDRVAVATCQRCGKALCKECASKYEICYCDDCVRIMHQDAVNEHEAQKQSDIFAHRNEIIKLVVIGCIAGAAFLAISLFSGGDYLWYEYLGYFVMGFGLPFGWKVLSWWPIFYGNSENMVLAVILNALKLGLSIFLGIFCFIGLVIYHLVKMHQINKE